MMVTSLEFKTNFGKYIKLVEAEGIYVIKDGKTIGIFSDPNINRL